jgi:tetratricopeptide (TPR) repeat protein
VNKAEFAILLDNPSHLDKDAAGALRKMVSSYPYFQASQILLTKALSNTNHYEYEKELKKASVLTFDRELLYNYIFDSLPAHMAQESITQSALTDDKPQKVQLLDVSIEPIINVSSEDVSATHHAEVELSEALPEKELVAEDVMPKQEVESEIKNLSEPEVLTSKSEPVLKSGEMHSFAEWLQLTAGKEIDSDSEVESVESSEEDKDAHVETDLRKPELQTANNIQLFDSILDKFIKENPSIRRPKADFYNPVNMAKQSVQEDEELVTETLATIYHQQGAYKKAIKVYEKLCLIYPHKMAYFADLIRKIKEEQKND